MVLALPAEEGLGFLRTCLVEGDPESERRARRGRQRALALSICLQIVVVASLVLIPLLGNGERISLKSMTPLPPYARFGDHPQNPEPEHTPRPNRPACTFCFSGHIPQGIVTDDPSTPQQPSDNNIDDSDISRYGDPHGDPNGFLHSDSTRGPKPPDEQGSHVNQTPARHRISEPVQAAQLFHRVEPVYPPLARQLRREGRVELRAVIATDGTIQSLEVISGDPLLIRSALDAVRDWRYHPTILNGQPIEVETHITVIYTLSH
jgi:periplasmic protein TonB